MNIYVRLAIVAVLVVAVFALFGMWAQIGDDLRGIFTRA